MSLRTAEYAKKTQISLEFITLTLFGVVVIVLGCAWAVAVYPKYSILFLIFGAPALTFGYCLFGSFLLREKEILSTLLQMILSAIIALAFEAVYYYDLPVTQRSLNLASDLYAIAFVYLLFITVSFFLQNAIRSAVGAFADQENIDKYVQSFQTEMSSKKIRYEIRNKWLAMLSGLRIIEDKSAGQEIKLRLFKTGTNLYIGLYGHEKDGKTFLHMVPYCIYESLRRKDVFVNDEIKGFLSPQCSQLSEKLSLTECKDEKCVKRSKETRFDALKFFLYPARFPFMSIFSRREEAAGVFLAVFSIMFLAQLRISGTISDTIFAGFSGITVAVMLAIIGLRSRQS